MTEDQALAAARAIEERKLRASRQAARAAWVTACQEAGITKTEAHALYGAGPWCKELRPREWATLKNADHRKVDAWARAHAGWELKDFPFAGSTPRRQAWAKYALEVFFAGDIPREEAPTTTWWDLALAK